MKRQAAIARFFKGTVAGGAAILVVAVLIFTPVAAEAASVTVSWDAGMEANLAGYTVHWGTASGSYPNRADTGMSTSWTVTELTPGATYYLAATARDSAGNESVFSNEVVYAVPGVPTIALAGNGVAIANGDATPSSADGTDFGGIELGGGAVTRTFTVRNDGSAPLNLTGTPRVVVGGANAADFTVTLQPSTPLAPDGSTAFEVRFTPSAVGARSATLSIASDDPAENPCGFSIQGIGSRAAETVTAPSAPSVQGRVEAGSTVTFSLGGAASSWGDPLQYEVEWGDGTTSGWLPAGTVTASHAWLKAGNYGVRARARCAGHTGVESAWSAVLTVPVKPAKTPPSTPKGLRLVNRIS